MANKNRYNEEKKSGKGGIAIAISLFLAALVFIVLVIFSNTITNSGDKKTVVVSTQSIPENTVIKKDDAKKYFAVQSVGKDFAYDGTYSKLADLFAGGDIFITERLHSNQIISKDMITGSNSLVAGFTDPVEMGIRVASFEYAAGGTLRRGDTVDMCATDDAGTEVSIRVYILQAFDSSGDIVEANDDSSVAVAFNILIERDKYKHVAEVIATSSKFDLVKINDVY